MSIMWISPLTRLPYRVPTYYIHGSPAIASDPESTEVTVTVTVDTGVVLAAVHALVEDVSAMLAFCEEEDGDLPPQLDLTGAKETAAKEAESDPSGTTSASAPATATATVSDPTPDPAYMQFRDMLLWDVEANTPDAGQAVTLRPYIPVDFLQIPQKASTRDEAVTAIRVCDRLCTLVENQAHCIKNDQFLVAALIEHVFTQVVPVPKPRGVVISDTDRYKSSRAERREEKKKAGEAAKEEERKKRLEEKIKKEEADGKVRDISIVFPDSHLIVAMLMVFDYCRFLSVLGIQDSQEARGRVAQRC
jgi:hypothetical protein